MSLSVVLPKSFQSLRFRIALPFILFVAAGSLALVGWQESAARADERLEFLRLAKSNAGFIRGQRLPLTDRTAAALGQVLGVEVGFHEGGRAYGAGIPSGREAAVRHAGTVVEEGGKEWVALPVSEELSLVLARPSVRWGAGVHVRTLWGLGGFWGVSVALAVVLSHGLVAPLRQLVERLPHIEADKESSLPGAERPDEIGQVVRAYLSTRAQLLEERARREQAERLALLGRMATGLAHEIHNPLAAMRMHAELLQSASESELPEALSESLPVLLSENLRVEGLVNQWMFLARPEPPRLVPEEIGKVVAGQVRSLRPAASHAGVEVEDLIPSGLRVAMDSRRMGQAVGNILLNAFQAMPSGGRLRITGGVVDGSATLQFTDTGPGFSEEALRRYGELFFSEKEGGMGIGLNVSGEILRAHGGELMVRNPPGGGAVVVLQLPLL